MFNEPITEDIDHYSYSFAKNIIKSGIDYAAAMKLGLIDHPASSAMDLGKFIHAVLLGGEQNFVVKKYPDFRTKEAREWRDAQTLPIIDEAQFDTITYIADRIKEHPVASGLLLGENVEHEVKLTAQINNQDWVGYADALKKENGKVVFIVDLKTTTQFDRFKYQVRDMAYDLQSAVYQAISQNPEAKFYWVIAETVAPYRIGVAVASERLLEYGYEKLANANDAIAEFKKRDGEHDVNRINFDQNTTPDTIMVLGED